MIIIPVFDLYSKNAVAVTAAASTFMRRGPEGDALFVDEGETVSEGDALFVDEGETVFVDVGDPAPLLTETVSF